MLRIRTYFFIAIIVYVGVLISSLPASLLVSQIEKNPDINFQAHNVKGSVWNGHLDGVLASQPFFLKWDFNVLRLFLFELSLAIKVTSELFDVQSNFGFSSNRFYINNAEGKFKANDLNILLAQNDAGLQIENDLNFENVDMSRTNSKFNHAEGDFFWLGGRIQVENLPSGEVDFPELHGVLSDTDVGILFEVSPASSSQYAQQNLVSIELSHEGVLHLKIMEYIADFVDIPKELRQGTPDAVIFEVKRDVFPENGPL